MTLVVNNENIETQIERLEQAKRDFQSLESDENVSILDGIIGALENERDVFSGINTINARVDNINKYIASGIDGSNEDNFKSELEQCIGVIDDIIGKSNVDTTDDSLNRLKTTLSEYLDDVNNRQNSGGLLLNDENEKHLNSVKSTLQELGISYE
ncbi:hypothetical protein MKZ72_11340 [Staphylococcus hominis subsp. hominis]|uniref:hypothetical protein n=1 Tax=Staphylococcus hominis TaxID=1290 RepID=UPI001F5CE19A|nr:hypothetical protein [Staphylococcus hominis]MCI3137811.1 hypothetical protein [Staphylococcus hominis subsp. hominis]